MIRYILLILIAFNALAQGPEDFPGTPSRNFDLQISSTPRGRARQSTGSTSASKRHCQRDLFDVRTLTPCPPMLLSPAAPPPAPLTAASALPPPVALPLNLGLVAASALPSPPAVSLIDNNRHLFDDDYPDDDDVLPVVADLPVEEDEAVEEEEDSIDEFEGLTRPGILLSHIADIYAGSNEALRENIGVAVNRILSNIDQDHQAIIDAIDPNPEFSRVVHQFVDLFQRLTDNPDLIDTWNGLSFNSRLFFISEILQDAPEDSSVPPAA